MEISKTCTKCRLYKPLSQFYFRTDNNKYRNECKTCHLKKNNDWKTTHQEQYKESLRSWYQNNKKQHKQNCDRWRKNNKDIHNKRNAEWRKNNPEKQKEAIKRWKTEHPELVRESCRKRRAKKLDIKEEYSKEDEVYTRILFENKCVNCGSTNNLCIDHHKPLSKGNALSRQNAVLLCTFCNSSKQDKEPETFYTKEVFDKINNILGIGN